MFKSASVKRITLIFIAVMIVLASVSFIFQDIQTIILFILLGLVLVWLITIQLVHALYLYRNDHIRYSEETTSCPSCDKIIYKTDAICPYCGKKTN